MGADTHDVMAAPTRPLSIDTGGNRLVIGPTGFPRPQNSAAHTNDGARPARVWPSGWWLDLVLLAIFAAITLALVDNRLLNLDSAALSWSDNHRNALTWWTGYALSCLGQGGPLTYGTLLISVFLAWRRKTARPVLVPFAAFLLTYLVVGPIKVWSNRAVPHHGPIEMFAHPSGPYSMAYPSGHTANAIVWYGALLLLIGPYLPRFLYWSVRIGAPFIVATAMVYIDYHWLTDVVASVPLGLVLSRTLHRIPFDTIQLPPWGPRVRPQEQPTTQWQPLRQTAPARLPRVVTHPQRRPALLLAKLWTNGRSRPQTERGDLALRRRRPAMIGPASRAPHMGRGRGVTPRLRLHDEHD